MEVVRQHWDGAIYFPDCTFLTVSGARWNADEEWRQEAQLPSGKWHHVKASQGRCRLHASPSKTRSAGYRRVARARS